jgi:hypothetical protein
MTEYERFVLVFAKTRVYKFGHCCAHGAQINFGELTPYLTYGLHAYSTAVPCQ